MSRRTIVMSDIHGELDLFQKALTDNEYDVSKDKLIILGDMIDRGNQSFEVVTYVRELQSKGNVIVLMGNHEDMMVDAQETQDSSLWHYNGGMTTFRSYFGRKTDWTTHIKWMSKLPLFYEQKFGEKNFYFCHAGVNPHVSFSKQKREDLLWIREDFYGNNKKLSKTVVFGHSPMRDGFAYLPNGSIGIDGGMYYQGKATCLTILKNGATIVSVSTKEGFTKFKKRK